MYAVIRHSIRVVMLLVVAHAAISTRWPTQLETSYRVSGYRLAVGPQNLFGVFPGRNSTLNSFNGIQTLPGQSPFGMDGRAIYARIEPRL